MKTIITFPSEPRPEIIIDHGMEIEKVTMSNLHPDDENAYDSNEWEISSVRVYPNLEQVIVTMIRTRESIRKNRMG